MKGYNFTKSISNVLWSSKPWVTRGPGSYKNQKDSKLDWWYLLNWVNSYGYQSHNYQWCIEVQNDWSRDYFNCTGFGWFVACTDCSQEFSVTSRSTQTLKFVWTIENFLQSMAMFSYSWYCSWSILTNWKIEVELQWTWSIRINSTTILAANTIYNIIIRINNSLPTWTARVVWDADIFINWVKEIKTSSTQWTNTTTWSFLNRWAYNSTTNRWIWKMYSLTLRDRALSDWECASEWASNFSIVNTDHLRTRSTSNTSRIIWRQAPNYSLIWNTKLGNDADGDHFLFRWNANGVAWVWATAVMNSTLTSYLDNNKSFTMKVKCKIISAVSSQSWGLFCSNFDIWFQCITSGIQFWARNWGTINGFTMWISLNQVYELFLDYDANTQKIYAYNWTTLLNPWGLAIPWAFTINDLNIGDNGILWWSPFSNEKKIYHARIYGKILSSAEKSADMALWNTIPNDPLILYEIRPEGRKDVQLLSNIDNLTAAGWSKWANTTITQNYWADPDWDILSTRVQFTWVGWVGSNKIDQTVTTAGMGLWAAELASKVMMIRCFVRSSVVWQKFRLRMTHQWVADYYTGDQTATAEWKEYIYPQTFTWATNGTGITAWVVGASDWSAADIEVRRPKVFFSTENVYDYSCSIGHVWRFSNVAYEVIIKPDIDAADNASSQAILMTPRRYIQLRTANNNLQFRRETKRNANSPVYSLWAWRRSKVHVLCVAYLDIPTSNFVHEIWVEWELKSTHQSKYLNPSTFYSSMTMWTYGWMYYSGWISSVKWYLWSLTTSEKQNCCKGYEPLNALKFLHMWPDRSESISDKNAVDVKTKKRVLTLVNGVSRWYL